MFYFKELSALDPEVIQQLSELDVESLKRLENISNSLNGNGTGGGIDPSLLLLLGGGNGNPSSQSSGGSSVDGDDPIPVHPKLLRQLKLTSIFRPVFLYTVERALVARTER